MKSIIVYFYGTLQDWSAKSGSVDCCAVAEYPDKRDVFKIIIHAMDCCAPGTLWERHLYEALDNELKYEIMYDLSDPGEKITDEEIVEFPSHFGYYEEGNDGLQLQYVPEGYTTKKEYRVRARYFIRISSENEKLMEELPKSIEYWWQSYSLGMSCVVNVLVIKENELDTLLKAIEERLV